MTACNTWASVLRAGARAGVLLSNIFLVLPAHAAAVASGQNLPPFDFSDAFYLSNGIDPTTIVGRPNGTPPVSVIDNTENGPDFNNVRLLQQTAAFDGSGHPIFFSVTGLPTPASFLNNAAGQHEHDIAEQYKVYEFPRAANAPFAVFPKRQDLVADLSNGYFSNNLLGIWQINIVRYTTAATNTPAGQAALAQLAQENGLDLDGTPLIKKLSDIQNLAQQGFVTIQVPAETGQGFRWFFCPVIKDPRDGAIAPDATLTVISNADGNPIASEKANFDAFHCLQETGDFCNNGGFAGVVANYGFGTVAACPCGNASGAQDGCTNSLGVGGRLRATGNATVSTDTIVLTGSQMPSSTVLYFQGTIATSTAFGDGLKVAGGTAVRLGTRLNVGGTSTFPSSGSALSTAGGVHAGDTRYYQAWYRNNAVFCSPDNFNFTNGVRITWGL